MPTREEEYWAGGKETRGEPLCPNCGKLARPSRRRRGWWECAKNEKCRNYKHKILFPSPSYGARGKPSWWERLLGKK